MSVLCPHCGMSINGSSNPNGSRPKEGTLTGQVWGVCDTLRGSLGRVPTRKEVITLGTQKGLNYSTIVTQYQRWKTFQGQNPQTGQYHPEGSDTHTGVTSTQV